MNHGTVLLQRARQAAEQLRAHETAPLRCEDSLKACSTCSPSTHMLSVVSSGAGGTALFCCCSLCCYILGASYSRSTQEGCEQLRLVTGFRTNILIVACQVVPRASL